MAPTPPISATLAEFIADAQILHGSIAVFSLNSTAMGNHEIRAFDYVNRPYEPVRDAIKNDALNIFRRATKLAEDRSEALVASLSVEIAGVQLAKDIAIVIGEPREESPGRSALSRVTRVAVEWQAADSPRLFPEMVAELSVYPLSFTETQVELIGRYEPPLGLFGSAVDALVGKRVAEASVHRFVGAVVERLRQDLA